MARKKGFHLRGTIELRAKLKKNATMRDVVDIVNLNTKEMLAKQTRYSAVDTGFMRRSNGMEILDDGLTGITYNKAEYAPYVDKGTRFMAAQPFISAAYNNQKPLFLRDMERLMR